MRSGTESENPVGRGKSRRRLGSWQKAARYVRYNPRKKANCDKPGGFLTKQSWRGTSCAARPGTSCVHRDRRRAGHPRGQGRQPRSTHSLTERQRAAAADYQLTDRPSVTLCSRLLSCVLRRSADTDPPPPTLSRSLFPSKSRGKHVFGRSFRGAEMYVSTGGVHDAPAADFRSQK
jgi:hypothetical protein